MTFTGWGDGWLIGALLFCFFWVTALIWVIKDVNARSDNLGFQFISVVFVLVLTPLLGLPLYLALRPQGWKWDKTPWRHALLAKLQTCKNCHQLMPVEYDCCVQCGCALKVVCRECGAFYADEYEYCPFCGAPHLDD